MNKQEQDSVDFKKKKFAFIRRGSPLFFGACTTGIGLILPVFAYLLRHEALYLFEIILAVPFLLGISAAFGANRLNELRVDFSRKNSLKSQVKTHEYLLDSAGLGAWEWSLDSNEVIFDSRCHKILGENLISRSENFSDWDRRIHKEDRERRANDLKSYLKGLSPKYENVHRVRHEDGHWIWVLDRGQISEWGSNGSPLRFIGTYLDISKHKDSEHLNAELQRMGNIGGWELDLKTGVTLWTEQVYDIHEVLRGTPTDKIMSMNYYPFEERQRLEKLIESCVKGEPGLGVFKFVTARGNLKWVEVMAVPESNADGVTTRIRGTFRDTTQTENLYRDLRAKNLQFEQSQTVARIGSWDLDVNSKNMIWSEQMYNLFAVSQRNGPPNMEEHQYLIHQDDRAAWLKAFELCRQEKKSFKLRFRSIFPNRLVWLEAFGEAVLNSNSEVSGICGTCQDVSEIVQKEEESKLAFKSLKIGSWSFNPNTQELIWDQSNYDVFEIKPSDFIGHYQAWESTLTPESKDISVRELQLALEGKKEFNHTFQIQTKTGKRKWIAGRGHVVRSADGKPQVMYGINWDRTSEIETLAALEQERLRLIHSAKLASLGEMSAGVAHEINNPLAIISGSLAILKKSKETPGAHIEKIERSQRAIERIVKIVNGLRTFSRSDNKSEYQIESVSRILEEVLVLVSGRANRAGVSLNICRDQDVQLYCNKLEIEQVFVNLINNSIDAAKQMPQKWARVIVETTTDEVVVLVVDSGAGISKEVEAKIFDPFFTTKKVGDGTGLGLSISKGIVDEHQGTIRIDHHFGNTCFELRFKKYVTSAKAA